jgi:2-oxo-4-hydroxy-4-carboxy-5-ureidoimidazoline decarboxylase
MTGGRMSLGELNTLPPAAFVAVLGGVFEHSPWVAERVLAARPFASVEALHAAMAGVVDAAGGDAQLALLRAHPELAGRAMIRNELTAESSQEQAGAGLTQCSPEEYARLQDLNARYNAKFGFPFIVAVRGLDRGGILERITARIANDHATEFGEALAQVARIARLRLDALLAG